MQGHGVNAALSPAARPAPARKRVVVAGFMATCPIAGVVWQHIHYIVGLIRLGHDVWYVEDYGKFPYNPETFDISEDYGHAVRTLEKLARQYGFEDKWAFRARYLPEMPSIGLDNARVRELYLEADAILNICGSQDMNEDLLASDRLIYIESDPGVEQIKVAQGNAATTEYLRQHNKLFTFGELVPTADFVVPVSGMEWHTTRQPVVTDLWYDGSTPPDDAAWTSIANWSTGGQKDIEWDGDTYLWSKSLEFVRFIDAPAALRDPVELASEITDPEIHDEFIAKGWQLRTPHDLSPDFAGYQDYMRQSRGEFTVAKDQYVRLRTGWFSDRSACYLAAGRPVITQETGFSQVYGGDGGLFGFTTLDDIAAAAEAVRADYPGQCKAALDVAREVFEAEGVVGQILADAGV